MTTTRLFKKSTTFLSFSFVLIFSHAKAQSYMSQSQLNVIVNITNYSYSNNFYLPYNPYPQYSMTDIWGGMLQARQDRYDYAFNILKTEMNKLKNLELVNDYDAALLNNTRNQIIAYTQQNFTKVDLSIYDNFTSWLNYFTSIYSVASVKQEITLLKSINAELNRIRYKDPDNFYKSDRYKDLMNALSELKTIDKDSISSLSWKYGLF